MNLYTQLILQTVQLTFLDEQNENLVCSNNNNKSNCVLFFVFCINQSIKIFRHEASSSSSQGQSGQQATSSRCCYVYDIEKPCRFDSVPALVSYYCRVSLREYNHNLDVVLTYGASKYKFGKTSEWSLDKLYASFRNAFVEYEQLTKRCDRLESELSGVRDTIESKRKQAASLDKCILIYKEHVQLADQTIGANMLKKSNAISTTRLLALQFMPSSLSSKSETPKDEEVASANATLTEGRRRMCVRIRELQARREQLDKEVDYMRHLLAQLQEELDVAKPELVELRKKRENYHMWLVQRGENDDRIQDALNNEAPTSSSIQQQADPSSVVPLSPPPPPPPPSSRGDDHLSFEASSPTTSKKKLKQPQTTPPPQQQQQASSLLDSLNWYRSECDRDEATRLLAEREQGTFLLRPCKHPNAKYVLSVAHAGQVKHVLVDETSDGCFIKSVNTARRRGLPSQTTNNSSSSLVSIAAAAAAATTTTADTTDTVATNDATADEMAPRPFKTLSELVAYYSTHEIRATNLHLDTTLKHPAFCHRSDSVSGAHPFI